MKEELSEYVDEDLEERRRQWEGIHNDEAAQYRLPFEDSSETGGAACCLFFTIGVGAIFMVSGYGLYKVIILLL